LENENVKVKKKPKGLIIGLAIALVAIIIIGVVLFILKPWSDGYVATVDTMNVSKQEYKVISKFNMGEYLSSISKNSDESYDWSTKVDGQTAKDQVKKSTLDNIQEIKIQLLKAKEEGIKLTDDDLNNIDSGINQRISNYGSEAKAEEAIMSTYGVTLEDYKGVYKDLYLVQKYNSAEREKITVSDDDIQKYYDANKKEYDKVTVTHILISTVDSNGQAVSASKKSEAKKKAEDLMAQVKAGADIKTLAEKNSQDPGVTSNKGEYTFGKGEMVAEFENWAFASHNAGDVGIVESSYGYHVIQFQKRVVSTFKDVKDTIKSTLVSTKYNDQLTKSLEAWKKESRFAIKTNDSFTAKVDKEIYGF
jgi:foldase protein PrsA